MKPEKIKVEAVSEVINAVRGLLSRFASKQWADPAADKATGVLVEYSQKNRSKVRFSLVTRDKIGVAVVFDFNDLSREYIDNMVEGVVGKIEAERKRRQEATLIVLPMRSAIGAVH